MKVVILCGGKGTRLAEETVMRPKPMVEIGGKPILWHIMKNYAAHGFNEFVLALGYKADYIKDGKRTAVAKNHNPFAVNDVIFAKMLGHDWRELNRTGCSLVWGHPQGPTLTRSLIEGLEEAVELGGGKVLLFGCAAGDVGIAAIFEVTDRKSGRKQ